MSYCVHCGVELEESAQRCPLCNTPVIDPAILAAEDAQTFFPTQPAQVEPVSRRGMALLISSMLASVAICCGLLNLVLKPQMAWSLFVVGAAAMLWVWTVLPLITPKTPLWLRLTLDVAAVGLYVWIISLALHGQHWFVGLAVPLLLFSALTVGVMGWILKRHHSILSTFTIALAALGLYALEIELCCDRFFSQKLDLGWSLVVCAVCLGLCVPLIVVRRVPSLREEVRRRFHI